jgi:hypothetical protein
MRFLFRWTFRLLILILVLAIGLFLTKDALTKWWIVSEFREQGMDVQIGQLEIGFPLNSSIAANKITVFNLPEYGGSAMLKIDDLYIDCDFSELMNFRRKLKPHFRQIRIRIKEFNLVETNQGSRNLISLPDAIAKTTAQLALDDSPLYFTVGNLNFSWSNLSFTSISANGSTTGSNKMTVNIENHISQDLKTLKDLRPLFTKISKPISTSLVTKLFGRFFD